MNNTIVLRIAALDVARGIAILGTLWTNIWLFTNLDGLLGAVNTLETPPLDQRFITSLSQGKFLALLSLLFGVGMAIQFNSARQWPGRYLHRMLILLLDGALNYLFIAEFDVLMGYAITGMVVSYLLLTRPRTRWIFIFCCGILHILFISLIAYLNYILPYEYEHIPTPYAHGSFIELLVFRIENIIYFRAESVFIFPLTIALFLLGDWLYRQGLFNAENRRIRKNLMLLGAAALPLDLALGLSGNDVAVLAERYLTAPVVALGLLGLIIECCQRYGTQALPARLLASVGRTALSCYLLQNLLGGILFYGWGFGLVNHIQSWHTAATMLAYIGIATTITLFAHLWLQRFRNGPMEWLWKKIA